MLLITAGERCGPYLVMLSAAKGRIECPLLVPICILVESCRYLTPAGHRGERGQNSGEYGPSWSFPELKRQKVKIRYLGIKKR